MRSLSGEFGQIRTYYVSAPRGLSRYAGLAAMYKFKLKKGEKK